MTKPNEKQLFQVQNILQTLAEATEHFSDLIKKRELNQSIYMFSSIVEGSQAVIHMLHAQDNRFSEQTKKLEQYLLLIANQLEAGNFIKIAEIVQFSLQPLFNRLNESFLQQVGNQKQNKTIKIGIFHSWGNPKSFYPEARMNAMLQESKNQATQLYFFTSEDINFADQRIQADTFQDGNWERVTIPFPDVIHNVGAGKKSHAERKLRRHIPFTSFHVGNKFSLPRRMVQYRKYAELLVPFTVCIDAKKVYDFLEKHPRVVFKALSSNRGENIFFITKKGSRYILLDQKKERILNADAFQEFLDQIILREKGSFIIQRYIHTRTKADEPYHFRAHVQKNGEGKWQLTHIYPRIGNKKTNLSNISTEGRVEDFPAFLRNEFGEKSGKQYETEILQLSVDVAWHLDKLYGLALDELGLDFAIDETGKIWMHEANNGPQTAYHEEKRAVNTIAYAKYIAENGVMYTQQSIHAANQFNASGSKLPIMKINEQRCIGMLTEKTQENTLVFAFVEAAAARQCTFYQFTPNDIDFDRELIRGSFYEDGEWRQQITAYPNVIIDQLKWRGHADAQFIYDELSDVPFTNEYPVQTHQQSAIYEQLLADDALAPMIASYQKVRKPHHVIQWLEKYGSVQVKPEKFGATMYMKHMVNRQTLIVEGNKHSIYSDLKLKHLIQEKIDKHAYIVQAAPGNKPVDDTYTSIHLHLIKDRKQEWSFIHTTGQTQHFQDDNAVEMDEKELSAFLENDKTAEQKIKDIAVQIANAMETSWDISELYIVLAINPNKEISMMEVNPNGPNAIYDEQKYAEAFVEWANALAEDKTKPLGNH